VLEQDDNTEREKESEKVTERHNDKENSLVRFLYLKVIFHLNISERPSLASKIHPSYLSYKTRLREKEKEREKDVKAGRQHRERKRARK
jgi:hypothetical protein